MQSPNKRVRRASILLLEGLEDTFRIRLGKIRIVYTILWGEKAIIVSRIEKRGTVFD
ncbi:MAG: type II toxin-antitoxin system RelE/ParE family toxin [Candidatus Aenigmarchaeota archaeon]|nr:type II toxin-antitoxin system RelE/ParE family toxin [Candidatus Aenigmarchaeota archaeon]